MTTLIENLTALNDKLLAWVDKESEKSCKYVLKNFVYIIIDMLVGIAFSIGVAIMIIAWIINPLRKLKNKN